jgi:hypothetical protein
MLSGNLGRSIRYELLPLEVFAKRLFNIFYADIEGSNEEQFISYMAEFYRFNNESEWKPFKVNMGPVLEEIPIQLTTFSEWMKMQDWSEEINTTAG